MFSNSDDRSLIRNRKIKVGLLVIIAISMVWSTIAVSVIYRNAYALISVLFIIFVPIPVAMCNEDDDEAFPGDRSVLVDIIKAVGYITSLSSVTLAFGVPLILMYKGDIGPDMFAWTSMIAFMGGGMDILIVHWILTKKM